MIAYRIQAIDPTTGEYFFVDDYGFYYESTAYSVLAVLTDKLEAKGIDLNQVTIEEYLHLKECY